MTHLFSAAESREFTCASQGVDEPDPLHDMNGRAAEPSVEGELNLWLFVRSARSAQGRLEPLELSMGACYPV